MKEVLTEREDKEKVINFSLIFFILSPGFKASKIAAKKREVKNTQNKAIKTFRSTVAETSDTPRTTLITNQKHRKEVIAIMSIRATTATAAIAITTTIGRIVNTIIIACDKLSFHNRLYIYCDDLSYFEADYSDL